MAERGIREYDAKRMLASELHRLTGGTVVYEGKVALVAPETDWDALVREHPWLCTERLVVKPDQLFGKRGKHGLLLIDGDLDKARAWIGERMNQETLVGETRGILTHFLIEPFVPHAADAEWYVAIRPEREADVLYFSTRGGIYVEENWDQVIQVQVPVTLSIDDVDLEGRLAHLGPSRDAVVAFVRALFRFYAENDFTYLEVNPFTFGPDGGIVPLDMVAKVDDTASFDHRQTWGNLEYPRAFGEKFSKEEAYVRYLDEQSGASLKLSILNPNGRIWTMVAGGGASIIYADTICDMKLAPELANYGEYSGDPTTDLTYAYAKTVLDLMTRTYDPRGKVLLIGGGIANFTDVAKTFTGIVQALTEYREKLIANNVRIYVRRGGPNYREGLMRMRKLGETLGVPIEVYGPETHMTRIVPLALGNPA